MPTSAGRCSRGSCSSITKYWSILLCRHRGRIDWNKKLWRHSLEQFPDFWEPLVAELGRSERREGAALYVQGLLLPGER